MKKALVFLCLLALAVPALAAVDGKTEFSIVGQGVNLKDGPTTYEVAGGVLFPLGTGIAVLGPDVVLSDDDFLTRAGIGLEINVPGQSGGFFFGGTAHYFLKDVDDADSWTADGRAGFKLPLGPGALLKVYLSQPIGGRFNDVADISGNIGITAKF